jgi:hypothetical protein
MSKETEIQKSSSALPAAPSFMPESSAGLEQVGFKDLILPRLALCQNNSRARDKQNAKEYIKGLEEGQFYNTLSREILGESITVVPLFFYHSRMMFKDLDQGGGMLCQAPDGVSCQLNNGGPCLHSAWGKGGEPPECMEFFNYPCLVYKGPGKEPNQELIIASMKTTGLKAGRTLNSLMRMRGRAAFAGIYDLKAIPASNKAGQNYYTWEAKNSSKGDLPGWVDAELYSYAEEQYKIVAEGLKSGAIKIDDSDIDSDTSSEV